MDSGVGIVVALVALLIAVLLEGGSPAAFANLPAMVIIFGGTFGATMASFSVKEFLRLPRLVAVSMKPRPVDAAALRARLVGFAERARREGLLSLETDVDQVEDPFLRRGLQMVIDGLEPEVVEEILELEIEAIAQRHQRGVAMMTAMGGYAPTMGIIGTVMGLVNVLSRLDEPGELGHSIAVAFIATLIGILTANVLWLPIASNLRQKDAAEGAQRRMALTGILAIQAGDNPRIVGQKLQSFLDPLAAAATVTNQAAPAAGPAVAVTEPA